MNTDRQRSQQETPPEGQAEEQPRHDGRQAAQPGGGGLAFGPALQQQIQQALQPVLSRMQRQIAASMQQQMGPGAASSQAAAGEPPSGIQEAVAGIQPALRQAVATLKQAIDWLVRTARMLYETVRAWLERVVDTVRGLAVSALINALKAIAQPLLKAALEKGASALAQQGKQTLNSARRSAPSSS